MTNTEMRARLVARIEKLRDGAMDKDQDKALDAIVLMSGAVAIVRCIDFVALHAAQNFELRKVVDAMHEKSMKDTTDEVTREGLVEIHRASVKLLGELV